MIFRCRLPAGLVAAIGMLWSSVVLADSVVSMKSLLEEMTDLSRLASFPSPAYVSKQMASNDPQSVSPEDPAAWFANQDWDHWHGVVQREGRTEYVMMHADGPGAIVRIWSANPEGMLRIYIDGETKPALEVPLADVLGGKLKGLGEPIAGVYSKGYNLYLPIPYARHCEVTTDHKGFYYHVDYRTYVQGSTVESFRAGDIERLAGEIELQQKRLAAPREAMITSQRTDAFDVRIAPGETASIGQLSGQRAITEILLKVPADISESALRGLVLRIAFDEETTVEVPLGDFFGAAPGINAYQSLPLGVSKDGEMYAHWVMPFQNSASLEIRNLGKDAATLSGHIGSSARPWTDQSLHFHAGFRADANRTSQPPFDWNCLTATGKGRFVGASFTIDNPVRGWWGEGDEKFFVDGETQPSWFGTGTEDYYGYAWSSPDLFHHAYHNQPRCDGPETYGRTSVNRFHIMDDVPFEKSFKFDMELWHWTKCQVNMTATTYWYARPGAKDGFSDLTSEDVIVHPMPAYMPMKVAGAIEGESMKVLKKTATVGPQSWAELSGDQHLWWRGAKQGDVLVVGFDAPKAGRFRVRGRFMRAPDYGIARLAFNDQPVKGDLDLYADVVVQTPEMDLGEFDLHAGQNTLTVTAVDTNDQGKHEHLFGLDYLILRPMETTK